MAEGQFVIGPRVPAHTNLEAVPAAVAAIGQHPLLSGPGPVRPFQNRRHGADRHVAAADRGLERGEALRLAFAGLEHGRNPPRRPLPASGQVVEPFRVGGRIERRLELDPDAAADEVVELRCGHSLPHRVWLAEQQSGGLP